MVCIQVGERELSASALCVNTADDVENERMGELPLDSVRKVYDFIIPLKHVEEYYQAILSSCTTMLYLTLK